MSVAPATSTLLKFTSAAFIELEVLWPSHALNVQPGSPDLWASEERVLESSGVSRDFRMPKEIVPSLEMKREPTKELANTVTFSLNLSTPG